VKSVDSGQRCMIMSNLEERYLDPGVHFLCSVLRIQNGIDM
jgi:hypothetical protein